MMKSAEELPERRLVRYASSGYVSFARQKSAVDMGLRGFGGNLYFGVPEWVLEFRELRGRLI